MVRPFDTNKNTITVDPHITTSDYTTVRNLVEPARGTSLPRKQARKADKHIMLAALVLNTERPKKIIPDTVDVEVSGDYHNSPLQRWVGRVCSHKLHVPVYDLQSRHLGTTDMFKARSFEKLLRHARS